VELAKKEKGEAKENEEKATIDKSKVKGTNEKALKNKFEVETKDSKSLKEKEEVEQIAKKVHATIQKLYKEVPEVPIDPDYFQHEMREEI
jgi:hypothetical protein